MKYTMILNYFLTYKICLLENVKLVGLKGMSLYLKVANNEIPY